MNSARGTLYPRASNKPRLPARFSFLFFPPPFRKETVSFSSVMPRAHVFQSNERVYTSKRPHQTETNLPWNPDSVILATTRKGRGTNASHDCVRVFSLGLRARIRKRGGLPRDRETKRQKDREAKREREREGGFVYSFSRGLKMWRRPSRPRY